MNKRGFTMVELIAVIIVLGIILMVTFPVINSVIKRTRRSSAEKSIVLFGRTIEEVAVRYELENGIEVTGIFTTYDGHILNGPDNITLLVDYGGDAVICDNIQINSDKEVYLNNCSVKGRFISGYSYGTN